MHKFLVCVIFSIFQQPLRQFTVAILAKFDKGRFHTKNCMQDNNTSKGGKGNTYTDDSDHLLCSNYSMPVLSRLVKALTVKFFPNGSIPVLSQFIAWLNLDLVLKHAIYHGMTAYAKDVAICVPSLHRFSIATI